MSPLAIVVGEPTLGHDVTWQAPSGGTTTFGELPGYQFVVVTSPEPRYSEVFNQVQQLSGLRRGWDGHDGMPAQEQPIGQALTFLMQLETLYRGVVAPPIVGPLADGGVAFVWPQERHEIEILFLHDGSSEFAVTDRNEGRVTEVHENIGLLDLLSIVPRYLIV